MGKWLSLGVECRAHLQVQVQAQVGELILQEDTEVHVLHRVYHDVDELHAGHLSGKGHEQVSDPLDGWFSVPQPPIYPQVCLPLYTAHSTNPASSLPTFLPSVPSLSDVHPSLDNHTVLTLCRGRYPGPWLYLAPESGPTQAGLLSSP